MTRVHRAVGYSIITQYSAQIISLVTIAILARLLTPAEVGVYAVAAAVALLVTELRTLGAGQYLIRETEITEEKIRSATGLTIVVSWSLAFLIAVCAPGIASFYNEQALTIIFLIIATSFLFSPFSSIPHALLSRKLMFHSLFVATLISTLVRSGSSIAFVLLGFSYYGLALGVLFGAIANMVVLSFYRPKGTPWLPSFSNMKELFHFGVFTSIANMLQQFSLSIPDLVLGRVATMREVGLFSRGLGVIVFINNILGKAVAPVVLPHLSEVKREGASVADAYLRAIVLQAIFCWPIFAVVNVCSYSMIRALFGDQWDAAVPIASVLAVWAIFQSTHAFSSYALLAVEKEKLLLKKEILIFLVRFVAILYAAPSGMLMVAWSIVLAGVFEFLLNSWVIKRALKIGYLHFLKSFSPAVFITIFCWGGVKLLDSYLGFQQMNPWTALSIIGACMVLLWLMLLRITRHEAWTIVMQIACRFSSIKIN